MLINNFKVSRNFKLSEFESPDTKEVILDYDLLYGIQMTRDEIDRPITITSGYRTEKHNERVGGKKTSQHRIGTAVDISTVNLNVAKTIIELRRSGFAQIIYYRSKKIIHCAIYKKNPTV